MPLYEYRCTKCGHRFEKIQSFSADPEKVCPKCGNATLVRPLTAPRFQFKGAGWYVNDYAAKSGASSSESAPADAKPGSESKPSESKPSESKTETTASTPSSAPASTTPSSSSSESTS